MGEINYYMYVGLNKITGMIELTYGDIDRKEYPNFIKIRNINEFLKIYRSTPNWYNLEGSDNIYSPYIGKLKIAYDVLVDKRRKEYIRTNIDFSKKFAMPNNGGQYKLVYQPKTGAIFLALRKPNDKTSRCCVGITDELAEEFKENCKPTPWFNKNYKYKIWEQYTTELYHKWQSIVQSIYIKEYLKEVK